MFLVELLVVVFATLWLYELEVQIWGHGDFLGQDRLEEEGGRLTWSVHPTLVKEARGTAKVKVRAKEQGATGRASRVRRTE